MHDLPLYQPQVRPCESVVVLAEPGEPGQGGAVSAVVWVVAEADADAEALLGLVVEVVLVLLPSE